MLSQKYIYHVKSCSYRDETLIHKKWKHLPDNKIIIIFDADSVVMENKTLFMPTVSIYSNFYQEYLLMSVNLFTQTDKGNFSVDFDAKDMFSNRCDFSYYGVNGRKYFIIHYQKITIKYKLKKKVGMSKNMTIPTNGEFD